MAKETLDVRGKKTPKTVGHRTDASPAWVNHVVTLIKKVALQNRDFTTDEVWAEIATSINKPIEPRIIGVAIKKAQDNAWIDKTDRVRKSTRAACHGRPVAVWRSLLHTPRK